ncbi:MAG TPA: acyltransferase domain-containing protein [bacterium]|nr:acyltransferase domain-containing protein [bacterium]
MSFTITPSAGSGTLFSLTNGSISLSVSQNILSGLQALGWTNVVGSDNSFDVRALQQNVSQFLSEGRTEGLELPPAALDALRKFADTGDLTEPVITHLGTLIGAQQASLAPVASSTNGVDQVVRFAPTALASLYDVEESVLAKALYAEPVPALIQAEVASLRNALEAAGGVTRGLQDSRKASSEQKERIEAVWVTLARLDRLVGVSGPDVTDEVKELRGVAEVFLGRLGLKPMAQGALALREKKYRLLLVAPGQANEFIGLLKEVYQRSAAAKRFIDDVAVPTLRQEGIDVAGYLSQDMASLNLEQNKKVLNSSRISQPLILATQLALLEELKTYGYDPRFVTAGSGHSQGLLLAAVAAGISDPAEALGIVAVHGREMQNGTKPANAQLPMISILGLSRPELTRLSTQITLHLAFVNGIPGVCPPLTKDQLRDLSKRYEPRMLYGKVLPIDEMANDTEQRGRFAFLKNYFEGGFAVTDEQLQELGLPAGLNAVGRLVTRPDVESVYPTLVNMEPTDGSRTRGVMPAYIVSGTNEANRLLLSVIGNKDLGFEPHPSVRMVGFDWKDRKETVFPKTAILPTSSPFHHAGQQGAALQKSLMRADHTSGTSLFPVVLNSDSHTMDELGLNPRQQSQRITAEQHVRYVDWRKVVDRLLTFGDTALPAVFVNLGDDVVGGFTNAVAGSRAVTISSASKDGKGFASLTSRSAGDFRLRTAPLQDASLYEPIEPQVLAGRPWVDGKFLGPLGYLSSVRLGVDNERRDLIRRIRGLVDFTNPAAPKLKSDPLLGLLGAEGPFGMAAMTGPGSSKLVGAVARAGRTAFLAAGNYPPKNHLGVSTKQAFMTGLIDTAWETTRKTDSETGALTDGDLTFDGGKVVRGSIEDYERRSLTDGRFLNGGRFTGSMKSFGINLMHGAAGFCEPQCDATVEMFDRGLPIDKISIGLYLIQKLEELNRYIPMIARGMRFSPLLPNMKQIGEYQDVQIPYLKEQLKKYFEGGWRTFNKDNPGVYESDAVHARLAEAHPEYFRAGGFDQFMKDHPEIFMKMREGNDGGGHNSPDGTPTYRLVQDVVLNPDGEKTKNISTGGYADGVSLADALLSGAAGAQSGSLFEITQEADLPNQVKSLLMEVADPDSPRQAISTTSEFGKPINVALNAFAQAYQDLIGTNDANALLDILAREPVASVKFHRQFWDNGIATEDAALRGVLKNSALFDRVWDYLLGDRTTGREQAVEAIAKLVKEDEAAAYAAYQKRLKDHGDKPNPPVWNPVRDNAKAQLITFFRVFRTNMVQNGSVDAEWAYVLVGRSITRMPRQFLDRFKATGEFPTVQDVIGTIEGDAVQYLTQLMGRALAVEARRADAYELKAFDQVPGVQVHTESRGEDGSDTIRVRPTAGVDQKEFAKAALAQGFGAVARVMRQGDVFNRFFTPAPGREFYFDRVPAAEGERGPRVAGVRVTQDGREIARVTMPSETEVVMSYDVPRDAYGKLEPRRLSYSYALTEPFPGVQEWKLDRERVQRESTAIFGELLTGGPLDYEGKGVRDVYSDRRELPRERNAEYARIVGEGYEVFQRDGVTHPGLVGVESLRGAVLATNHPDFVTDRFQLLHGHFFQTFGAGIAAAGSIEVASRNTEVSALEKGGFKQSASIVSRDAEGRAVSQVDTGFINLDPKSRFAPMNEPAAAEIPSPLTAPNFSGFAAYPIWQAFTKVTRQDIIDYTAFDPNAIHHSDFVAHMAGLDQGIIAQGMLVHGKMVSHLIGGFLKGDLSRAVGVKTHFTGKVHPDEDLDLVLNRAGVQGDYEVLRFDAVNAEGNVVVTQEWTVKRSPQVLAFPGQGFQKAGMWDEVLRRYAAPQNAAPELSAAYARAAKAQKDFLKQVDETSLKEWGFRLSDVVKHNPKTLSFTVREAYDGQDYRGTRVGERVTVRNAQGVLSETDFAQPALYVSYVLDLIGMRELGLIDPNADVVYNSLGKIAGLVAVGAIDAVTGLKIARVRGACMGEVKGAFGVASLKNAGGLWALVSREADKIRSELGPDYDVYATNQNSTQQVGFAGTERGVKELIARLENGGTDGIKVQRLDKIINPFHTPLYGEAGDRFQRFLAGIPMETSGLNRLILNSTGRRFDASRGDIRASLADHIRMPIRVADGFEAAVTANPTADVLELGHVSELPKRLAETVVDRKLAWKGRGRSAQEHFGAITYATPDDRIEVKTRAAKIVRLVPKAAPAASPAVAGVSAPSAAASPAVAASAGFAPAGAGVAGKYLEPPVAGSPEHKTLSQDVRAITGALLARETGIYTGLRGGSIAPDDADHVGRAVAALAALGPGAIEGIEAELKFRQEASTRFSGNDKKVQEFLINSLEGSLPLLRDARKRLKESQGGGKGVDVDSPEFQTGVTKVVAKAAGDLGLVRVSRDQLTDRTSYVAEIGADGTLYKPGGKEPVQTKSRLDQVVANTTSRFVKMMTSDYKGIRFHMDKIEHNGAESNAWNFAVELRALEKQGTLGSLSESALASTRRRLANQLDADGIGRVRALAETAREQGFAGSARILDGLADEARESLRVGGLPPLHSFDMTMFEPLYGTEGRGREVTRGMAPEKAIAYLKENGLIDPALADRMADYVAGKASLKGERVLVTASGTISTPLVAFLLEQGAEVVLTTTRDRGSVNQELHDLFQDHAARGARLEVKTGFGFNPTNYTKLVDELTSDGFAPTIFLNGAGVSDYGLFNDVSQEDWHAVSESLVRAPLYILRQLAKWFQREQNGVTTAYLELASPAAHRPLTGSGSYRAAKNALDSLGWLEHLVNTENLRHADGAPFFVGKQLVVGWVNPGEEASGKLMTEMRDTSLGVEREAKQETGVLLHTFNGATMATAAMGVLHPAHRAKGERLNALGNFDHPKLEENGRLARIMEKVGKAEKDRHDKAREANGKRALTAVESLRHMGRTEEAEALDREQKDIQRRAESHPFQHGLLFRVWDTSFYVQDSARGVDTFDDKRHVKAKPDDLVAVSVAAVGPYGKTVVGNYRNPLERFGETGEWGGADWTELVRFMPDIPQDLKPEDYAKGVAPDGKPWREKIFSQAGLRQLDHLARRRRLEATKLDEDAMVPLAAGNRELIRRHRDAGHQVHVEEAFNSDTGERETRVYARVPQGEDVMSWVVDSLNVTTLADLPGGTDSFFKGITGISANESIIKSYATVLARISVSQMLRFMGMNATDIRREITAAAIDVVAGIGMVDFNPTDEMITAARVSEKTEKDAIIYAIPNAVTSPKTNQLGAAGTSTTTSEACATGPGALKLAEDAYFASKAHFQETLTAFTAGLVSEDRLYLAGVEMYLKAYFLWSVDHAQTPANVQSFDALGDRGAMARDDFMKKLGLPPYLGLASHNEDRDGFIAGVMIGAMAFYPRLLADLTGARPVARLIGVTGSTDFDPKISGGKAERSNTAPGVEGQVLVVTRLIERLERAGYVLEDIVAWFTHSTGTMGDDKQSEALRLALELANAAAPGTAIEVFLKAIFGHGLGATMFEQCLALAFLHAGYTLGQPSLSRLIEPTAENPHMFPSRSPLNVYGAIGRSPRRGVAGTNFGFHGENRAWAMFADTSGYTSVESAVAAMERKVRTEAQAVADWHANRGGKQDDITSYNTAHAPLDSHRHAQFLGAHARTLAMMMVEREMTGRSFDFDNNLENEVLAYESYLIQSGALPGRLSLAHAKAAKAVGADFPPPDQRVTEAHRRERTVEDGRVRNAYASYGDDFADVAGVVGVDQAFVADFLKKYDLVMGAINRGGSQPRDWTFLAKDYLVRIGNPKLAARLQSVLADLSRNYGNDSALAQATSLLVYQQASRNQADQVDWARIRQVWIARRQEGSAGSTH